MSTNRGDRRRANRASNPADTVDAAQISVEYALPPVDRSMLASSPLEKADNLFFAELNMAQINMEYDWAISKRNVRILMFAILGIIFAMVEVEYAYDGSASPKPTYQQNTATQTMKAFVSFFTIILLILIYDLYHYTLTRDKKAWYYALFSGATVGPLPRFFSWRYILPFLIEIYLCSLHIPPFCNFLYWSGGTKPFISDKVSIVVFVRLYLIIRVVRDSTALFRRRKLVEESGFRLRGGSHITTHTAMKVVFNSYPITVMLILVISSVFLLSFMMYIAERDTASTKFSFVTCICYTIFKMYMSQYHDVYPQTRLGHAVAEWDVIVGVVLLSFVVVLALKALSLRAYDAWAVTFLREYELREEEQDCAASYLAAWWQYRRMTRKARETAREKGVPFDERNKSPELTTAYIRTVQRYNQLREVSGYLVSMTKVSADPALEMVLQVKEMVNQVKSEVQGTLAEIEKDDAEIADNTHDMDQLEAIYRSQLVTLEKLDTLIAAKANDTKT